MPRTVTYRHSEDAPPRRVKDVLRSELHFSSRQIKQAKTRPNGLLVDGRPVFTVHEILPGQTLQATIGDDAPSQDILPVQGPLCILYEDDDVLVINKPAGQPVHPSMGHYTDTLANAVQWYYARQGINAVFRAVNRLDSGTSGVMVVAKNAHSQNRLITQAQQGVLVRQYLALATGVFAQACGRVDAPIAREEGSVLKRCVHPAGAPAATRYEVLGQRGQLSLLRLQLETGRTHQIRVHMAHLGHPLLGDFLYGTECALGRTALHSAYIGFEQPLTGAPLHFEVPMPQDMQHAWDTAQL